MTNWDALLAQLTSEELIRHLDEPDAAFIFKHTLTQETVYKSLLKTQRRALHRAVAEAMERAYPDRKGKLSEVLAFHWERAEVPDRARRYLFRAAQNASRHYANQEALDLLTRAIALGAHAPPEELVALYTARAQVYEFFSQYTEALDDYRTALPLARAAHRAYDECRIMSRIAWTLWLNGRGAEAIEMAFETDARARELQDQPVALRAYLVQGLVAQAEGNLQHAYPRLRRALFASQTGEERVLEGECWFYLGIQDNFMGRFARAAACARKAYEIKNGLQDRVGEIVSLYLLTRAQAGRGNYDAALDALEQGHALAKEARNPFGLAQYPNTRAWLAAELGDWETAFELDCAGLQIAQSASVRPPEISTLINLMLDCIALGKLTQAEIYRDQVGQWIGRPEFGFHAWRWQMRFADACARLHLARGELTLATDETEQLLNAATRTRSAKYRARGLMLQAHIHHARGETMAAESFYLAARDLADRLSYFPIRVHARRDALALHRDGDQARAELAQVIGELDRCLTHPDLRRAFARGIAQESSQ
ncbi:MAG: hypothetical protein HY868_19325 [Chloroflexi bacterium]|nr:hypothetical protein [Chloroflexota bacterium]